MFGAVPVLLLLALMAVCMEKTHYYEHLSQVLFKCSVQRAGFAPELIVINHSGQDCFYHEMRCTNCQLRMFAATFLVVLW